MSLYSQKTELCVLDTEKYCSSTCNCYLMRYINISLVKSQKCWDLNTGKKNVYKKLHSIFFFIFFSLKRFFKTVFHRIYNAFATLATVVTYIFVINLSINIHFRNTAIKIRTRYWLHITRTNKQLQETMPLALKSCFYKEILPCNNKMQVEWKNMDL